MHQPPQRAAHASLLSLLTLGLQSIDGSSVEDAFVYAAAGATEAFDYELGIGVGVDAAQAVAWYRKAERRGNAWAQAPLGRAATWSASELP
jgi:TPR repeat protein